jgi:glycosyltransferase involved in cell wall biosynthesis
MSPKGTGIHFMKLHQFSAGFNPGDAISNLMLVYKEKLKKFGYSGEIFSENISPYHKRTAKKFKNYSYKKDDIIIYHHSIHCGVLEFLYEIPKEVKKILIYHNVTPFHFYEPYDLRLTELLKKGRNDLKEIKDKFDLYYAVSNYNKNELIAENFLEVEVLPIIPDFSNLKKADKKRDNDIKKILFVGRIAPNKKQTDLLKITKVLKEYYDIPFVLQLVGHTSRESELYRDELGKLIKYLKIEDRVEFSEFVSNNTLCNYYNNADLFLCMSEHEGFCVPLLESMYFEVPIIAFDAGAVRETLGGAGILFNEKNYLHIAECIYKVLTDENLRARIINSQNNRLAEFLQNDPVSNLKIGLDRLNDA